jgi:phage tail sheath protein FI
MAFQLSPGVNVSEIDLTTVVPGVSSTIGAFVGNFQWGPANKISTVTSEQELLTMFGKPNSTNYVDWFTAANFLAYADNLKLVRAVKSDEGKNATSGTTRLLIDNRDVYETTYLGLTASNTAGMFAARYPGDLGNSLKVAMFAAPNTISFGTWAYKNYFNSVPGTTVYTRGVNGANDELHIVVIDEDGKFTGTGNTILETFAYLSKASDAKYEDGTENYYVDVINRKSKYIYILNHPLDNGGIGNNDTTNTWGLAAAGQAFTQNTDSYTFSLSGGVVGNVTSAEVTIGYDRFLNLDDTDISLVMTGAGNSTIATYVVNNLAEVRKDCVVFISPEQADVVDNFGDEANDVIAFRNTLPSSSYGFMDCNWKYQFDKYNNVYRWVPLNGDIAGLCARSDETRDPWFSPAGLTRGQVKNVAKLAWGPSKANRDDLYKNGINPVVTFTGEGTILYGDKTMLGRPSAFDRINVRRLFIVLEKAIAKAARSSLFEFNDEFTRAQFVALVTPYLRNVKGRRGIYDYKVVCDSTNNTPEVIDRNEFVGDIYIKPARSINFIQLNFIAVRTGVSFDEIVGKF